MPECRQWLSFSLNLLNVSAVEHSKWWYIFVLLQMGSELLFQWSTMSEKFWSFKDWLNVSRHRPTSLGREHNYRRCRAGIFIQRNIVSWPPTLAWYLCNVEDSLMPVLEVRTHVQPPVLRRKHFILPALDVTAAVGRTVLIIKCPVCIIMWMTTAIYK